jgi:hypothetical protein
LAENKRVHDLLSKYEIVPAPLTSGGVELSASTLITPESLPRRDGWVPDYVISVDGSLAPVAVDNGFPGAEVAYLTVATVLLDLKKMREMDAKRPVDPKLFRSTRTSDPVDAVLPGCNVTFQGETSPAASLRRGVIELFADQRAFETGETLLDTYHILLGYKPPASQNCPYKDGCGIDPEGAYQRGVGKYECQCPQKLPLYSTDALRFHERFNPAGSNGEIFAEIMQVLERLWLVHVLRGMEQRGHLNALSRLAVIMDGPLAVFGQPAWLSRAISEELGRLNGRLRSATGTDMLIVGVEKTGAFVEHFEKLCAAADKGRVPFAVAPQTALLLTDEYIKKQIIFSDGKKPYGEATYFGRKLLYRTKSGAKIVASLPYLEPQHRDLSTALPSQYPRLADALSVFDALVSSRYPNALIPVSLAHGEAAIPLRLGTRVLERLARELISSGD